MLAVDAQPLLHYELTDRILRVYHDVRHELGHGFLERVCHRAFAIALVDAGLEIEENVALAVWFRGRQIGHFVADIVVAARVLIEIKALAELEPRHTAQTLNYLRASDLEVALILNFGPKAETKRLVYSNARKNRLMRATGSL